jgi:hypothetical protein
MIDWPTSCAVMTGMVCIVLVFGMILAWIAGHNLRSEIQGATKDTRKLVEELAKVRIP